MAKLTASRRLRILIAACVLVLAGCASVGQPSGAGMMRGGSAAGVMGAAPQGYHFSALTCSAPISLPGANVRVMLGDMGLTTMMGGTAPLGSPMMLRAVPATVPAGQVSLVALNMGWRAHEVVILPLAVGSVAGQRVPGADGKVDEAGSVGEASSSCAPGAGAGIASGSVGWTTVTLAAGRYELVCNLPHHYADGMHSELVVT